jgi:hypothetical protein
MVLDGKEQLHEASATRNLPKSPRSQSLKSPRQSLAGKSDLSDVKEKVSFTRLASERLLL